MTEPLQRSAARRAPSPRHPRHPWRPWHAWRRRAATVVAALALGTGCFPGPTGWLDDYLARVERVTGVPNPVDELRVDPLLYPDRRTRVADLDALSTNRMGLVRSLTLRRCGLQDLVGERNSTLGKVMPPSRRLAYEVEFIRRVDVCLPTLEGDPDLVRLADELQAARATKMQALPALIWNATLGSDELAAGFSAGEARWKRSRPRLEQAREEIKVWRDAFDELMQVPGLVNETLSSAGRSMDRPRQPGDAGGGQADVRDRIAAAVEGPAQTLGNGAAGRLLATIAAAEAAMRASSAMVDAVQCSAASAAGSATRRPASPVAAAMEAAQVAEASWRQPKTPPGAPSGTPRDADAASPVDGEATNAPDEVALDPVRDPGAARPSETPAATNEPAVAESVGSEVTSEPADAPAGDDAPVLARDQAEILARVFEIFYVGEEGDRLERVGLQEFASLLEQEARPLVRAMGAAVERLEAGAPQGFLESDFRRRLLDPVPDAAASPANGAAPAEAQTVEAQTVEAQAVDAQTLDERFRRATAQHAAAWQRFFASCAITPAGLATP